MSRIETITHDNASPAQQALLEAVKNKLGVVPNFLAVLGQSPDALQAFLGLHHVAGSGQLDPQTRERIALVVAQDNSCEYCVSAHSAIGRKAGLSNDEITANRKGASHDQKAHAAVTFAQTINEHKGDLSDAEFQAIRNAGYSDAEIVEIIVHVGMNILTNMIGKISDVEIDFPKVSLDQKAA